MGSSVTAVVCTRNRYDVLSLCLTAIANQTLVPDELIIYDDGEHKDLRGLAPYNSIFALLTRKGIAWRVEFANGGGQVRCHSRSIGEAKGDFIWRVDDDEFPECDCLERLMDSFSDNIGAVGGLVLDPSNSVISSCASSQIDDIYLGLNTQWFSNNTVPYYVDHLYSTFVYRKSAAKPEYYANLSRIGHREETIFTYSLKKAGWKLLVEPQAITWHFRAPTGGIRDGERWMWELDEKVFREKLREWGINPKQFKIITLDNGLGDHYVFKKVLPKIKEKYSKYRLIIACCYPAVFRDSGISLISIAESKMIGTSDNIYKFMTENNWKKSLEEAYLAYY